jgi:transposase
MLPEVRPSQQTEAASLRRHRQAVERYKQIQKYHAKNVDVTTIAQRVGVRRLCVYRYLQMNERAFAQAAPVHEKEAHRAVSTPSGQTMERGRPQFPTTVAGTAGARQ